MDLREVREFIIDTSKYILTIIVVIFIVMYVATVQQVVGPSMDPAFKDQDIVVLNKLHYHIFDVKRYDIISLKYDGTKYLIKRVTCRLSLGEASTEIISLIYPHYLYPPMLTKKKIGFICKSLIPSRADTDC